MPPFDARHQELLEDYRELAREKHMMIRAKNAILGNLLQDFPEHASLIEKTFQTFWASEWED